MGHAGPDAGCFGRLFPVACVALCVSRCSLAWGRCWGCVLRSAPRFSTKIEVVGFMQGELCLPGCARRVLCSEMQLRADIIRSAFTEASDPVWRPAPTALTASSSPSSASQPLAPHSPFIALPPPAVALGGCSPQRRCPLPPRRGRAAAAATVLAATGVNPPPPRAVRLASPLPSWSSTPAAGTAAEATAAVEETKKTKNNQRNNATRKTQSSTHISHAICGEARRLPSSSPSLGPSQRTVRTVLRRAHVSSHRTSFF